MFVACLYITVFIIGVIGNILVLWVTFRSLFGQMLSRFIFNIALADLLFLLSLPFLAYNATAGWIFGSSMSRVIRALYMLGLYGSIFFMVLIAVHRYITVFHPLKRWTKTIQIIGFVWMLTVLASLPNVVFSCEIQGHSRTSCTYVFPSPDWQSFSILNINLLSFIIPLIIVVFCYSRLSWELSSLLHTSRYPDPDLNRQVQIRTRTLLAEVFVYFLFLGPINIVLFISVLNIQGYMNTGLVWFEAGPAGGERYCLQSLLFQPHHLLTLRTSFQERSHQVLSRVFWKIQFMCNSSSSRCGE